jgi:hypothetical protein
MDIASDITHMPTSIILLRGAVFFGWMLAFMGSMATIGLLPTVPLFVIGYMRIEGNERWSIVVPMALCVTAFIYTVFDQLLAIPWPQTELGNLFPALKDFIPSV